MAMGRPGFGPAGLYNSDPTTGDFAPGVGLTIATRTNANAVQATTAQPTSGSSPLSTVTQSIGDHPLTWVAVALGAVLIHKAISERHSDDHVADTRIGWTNFLVLPAFLFAGVWFYRWIGGIAAGKGVPGGKQVVSFFS